MSSGDGQYNNDFFLYKVYYKIVAIVNNIVVTSVSTASESMMTDGRPELISARER